MVMEKIYTKLTNHMKKFNYKLIFSNDMIDYKKKIFSRIIRISYELLLGTSIGEG